MPHILDSDDAYHLPGGAGGMGEGEWFVYRRGGPFGSALWVADQDGSPPRFDAYPHCPRERVDLAAVAAWVAGEWAAHGHMASGPMPAVSLDMWPVEAQVLAMAEEDARREVADLVHMRDTAHFGPIVRSQAARTLAANVGLRRPLTADEAAARDAAGYPLYRRCISAAYISYGHSPALWQRAVGNALGGGFVVA